MSNVRVGDEIHPLVDVMQQYQILFGHPRHNKSAMIVNKITGRRSFFGGSMRINLIVVVVLVRVDRHADEWRGGHHLRSFVAKTLHHLDIITSHLVRQLNDAVKDSALQSSVSLVPILLGWLFLSHRSCCCSGCCCVVVVRNFKMMASTWSSFKREDCKATGIGDTGLIVIVTNAIMTYLGSWMAKIICYPAWLPWWPWSAWWQSTDDK